MLSPCSQLNIQVSPLASTLAPRQQLQQTCMIECMQPFGEPPQLSVRFMSSSAPVQLLLRMPVPPSKFFSPLKVDGPDFFRRWKVLEGKEVQKIFKLKTSPLPPAEVERVASTGLRMAVLNGVDPNAANYVVAGWIVTKGHAQPQSDDTSVLMRLEVNAAAGMCRASVRAMNSDLISSVLQLVQSQLAAQGA
eukprot:scaffold183272_cov30-Tisochrysis_lutea.AAC.2